MPSDRPISAVELANADWQILADAIQRLESDWKSGVAPALASFVPSVPAPVRRCILVELIKVDQELRCRAGCARLLEKYLADWPELNEHPTLVTELLAAECLTRALWDVAPARAELLARFPQFAVGIDLAAIYREAASEVGDSTTTVQCATDGTVATLWPKRIDRYDSGAGVDARSDIYSLGVVLYRLLTGQLPYAGTVTDVLDNVVHRDPLAPRSVNHSVDPRLDAICLKAMAKNPADRYQTARDFASVLEEYLRLVIRPRTSRHARLAIVAVTVIALVALPVGIYYGAKVLGNRNEQPIQGDPFEGADAAKVLEVPDKLSINVPGRITEAGKPAWFRATAIRDGRMKVHAGNLHGPLDPFLRIYDADHKLITTAHRTAGMNAEVFLDARKGQSFLIEVRDTKGATGPFGMLVSHPQPGKEEFPDADEYPNNKADAAEKRFDATGEIKIDSRIETAGDQDWITFVVPKDGELQITVDLMRSSLDSHVELHDAERLVAQGHADVTRRVQAGERYWLVVRAGSEKGADDIKPPEERTGRYRLQVKIVEKE